MTIAETILKEQDSLYRDTPILTPVGEERRRLHILRDVRISIWGRRVVRFLEWIGWY